MYEPDERVRIQTTMPDDKNIYQVIERITLDEEGFRKGTILLNPNFNTIIGGRSTGKSTLLNVLYTQGIREHVVIFWKVVGRDAFEKREQKYGFK